MTPSQVACMILCTTCTLLKVTCLVLGSLYALGDLCYSATHIFRKMCNMLNYKISAIFVYSFLNMFALFINLGPLVLCADNAVSALPSDTCSV